MCQDNRATGRKNKRERESFQVYLPYSFNPFVINPYFIYLEVFLPRQELHGQTGLSGSFGASEASFEVSAGAETETSSFSVAFSNS